MMKWLKAIFPTINVKSGIRNPTATRDYAIKGGDGIRQWGEFADGATGRQVRAQAVGEAIKTRWAEIMRLALAADGETIMTTFPGEYLRFSPTIEVHSLKKQDQTADSMKKPCKSIKNESTFLHVSCLTSPL
jgi:hypothetical protein